jgi:hypothetical protein
MNYLEILQTILLIILVDRNLILRDRYKIAIENDSPYYNGLSNKMEKRYIAIWIYCKGKDKDFYWRTGGKRLIYFRLRF